jgi:hypothetical protein
MPDNEALVIPIIAILMPLVLVPTILVLKHRHSRREWEHKERMKAMDFRLPAPPSEAAALGRAIGQIGAGVPIVSVLTALATTLAWGPNNGDDVPMPAVAWGCAALISACAMGTSLMLALLHRRTSKAAEPTHLADNGKPVFDPDAFDVVSSRA